ncbi:hypothetical protein FGIG_04610 [Fasciola gigantica]|uniref:Uridylate-specific endoribonuclease n=1 Tax=Fasciola gigantica TaxID=46835 RepID=A0A504YWH6_FASGI|nr:hypothetical protein FGIG_04610 [Fasciola gigantica]
MRVLLLFLFCFLEYPGVDSTVPQKELDALFSRLWIFDKNEMRKFLDLELSPQGKIPHTGEDLDVAPTRLFASIDLRKLKKKPTIKAFINLMNNYHMEVGTDETTTREEELEISRFLDEVVKTKVMKEAHQFLRRHHLSSSNLVRFKRQLRDLWFRFYRRRSKQDSSAVRARVCGRNKRISNEASNLINYRGYFTQACGGPPGVMREGNFDIQSNRLSRTIFV